MEQAVRSQRCDSCGETIWRQDTWFQCPDCFALSTAYGGLFTHAKGAPSDFMAAVRAAGWTPGQSGMGGKRGKLSG